MRTEDGSSPVTAVFGFLVFLTFLFGAVQTSLHLFATSAVSSAAFEAARAMATESGGGCDQAVGRATAALGRYGDRASVSCPAAGAEDVTVRVSAPSPAPLLDGFFGFGLDLGQIEREATVRRERFRPGADG